MTLATSNPLLQPWNTPHGLPPFADIAPAHFKPAFEQALKEQLAEIDALASAPQAPSFDNTVAAFDRSGRLLARLDGLFYNLTSSETSPGTLSGVRTPPPTTPKVIEPTRTLSPSTNETPGGTSARTSSGMSTLPKVT